MTEILLDIYRKNISLMKIKNIILMLCTHIILFSSFVIYFFCMCHLESFPIILGCCGRHYKKCLVFLSVCLSISKYKTSLMKYLGVYTNFQGRDDITFGDLVYLFGVLCHFQHCTGHFMMGTFVGIRN